MVKKIVPRATLHPRHRKEKGKKFYGKAGLLFLPSAYVAGIVLIVILILVFLILSSFPFLSYSLTDDAAIEGNNVEF